MKKIISVLTILTAILAIICCTFGIFDKEKHNYSTIKTAYEEEITLYQEGVYARDSVSMASQAIAQDYITLFVGVPALLVTLYMAMKHGKIWMLFLAGFIGYFLYAYIPYATMLSYNKCFLLYVMLMAIGIYNFILCMIQIVKTEFPSYYFKYFPVKVLAVFQIITGVLLCGMWLSRIISAELACGAPVGLEHYSTLVIQAVDLAIIVPVSFISAYLLLKRNKIGYGLYVVLQVKGIVMAMAVTAMTIGMIRNGVKVSIMEIAFFPSILVISVTFLVYALWGIRRAKREET